MIEYPTHFTKQKQCTHPEDSCAHVHYQSLIGIRVTWFNNVFLFTFSGAVLRGQQIVPTSNPCVIMSRFMKKVGYYN